MNESKLLINEPPLQVLPSLAQVIGLNEAIVLQQIHYWLQTSKHDIQGKKWIYNSVENWKEQFPFWSAKTISRILKKLREEKLLLVKNLSRIKFDKTNWYTIDYGQLVLIDKDNLSVSDKDNLSQSIKTKCPYRYQETSDVISYEITLREFTHTTRRERFLTFLSKTKKEIDSRTLLEGVFDGLGHSDEEIETLIGLKNISHLAESRNKLIIGYRNLDREKADAFIKTLMQTSQDRYDSYPKKMLELIKNNVSLGSNPTYLKAKAEMIKNLADGFDKSNTGKSLKVLQEILGKLCQSYEQPKVNLRINPKIMEN